MPLNKVNYVDGQTLITAQNMNDIQDEVIRLGEKEIVQSDWLEQDENSLAYVKNKPFGAAGQYRVACTTETMLTSGKLIEINTKNDDYNNQMNDSRNNGSNVYYLYKISSGLIFDFYGIGVYQKIAFEYSSGQYLTIQDLKYGGGNIVSLSTYIDNPNIVSGKVYFYGDITYDLATSGIVLIEDSSDSILTPGLYVAFNAEKKSQITKVLINSSYLFNSPGALSMIDMPLAVNYAALVLDGVRQPLQPMIDSVQESLNNFSSALDNKVDKVGNKVLSDVNFTKAYESKVNNISNLENRISSLEYYHSPDYTDQKLMEQSAIMIANEIAANPHGAYLNTQELLTEYAKLMSGQTSDKVFSVVSDSDVLFAKMSDKTPTKEDFKKGFSTVLAYPDEIFGFMAIKPQIGLMIPDIAFDPDIWEELEAESAFTDLDEVGSFIFSDVFLIVQEGNSMGLPKGLYVPASFDMLVLGVQINGFDLSSSTAPVSRAQIEDILLFIEESMTTFTINGVAHRAIKGMTWGEWVNSRYNDTELTIITHWQNGEVIGVTSSYLLRPYTHVHPNEVIQAEEYRLGQETAEPT